MTQVTIGRCHTGPHGYVHHETPEVEPANQLPTEVEALP